MREPPTWTDEHIPHATTSHRDPHDRGGGEPGRDVGHPPGAVGTQLRHPEAVICVVLALGASAVYRATPRWREIALSTVGFAIAGFLLGLSITASSGDVAELAYHATVLPLLIATFIIALRTRALVTTT